VGRHRPKLRPNGYAQDIKAPDGFLLGGWRRVTKGGYIRLAKTRWTHPDMEKRIGDYCFVHVDCFLGTEASFTFNADKQWNPPWHGEQFKGGRTPMECMDIHAQQSELKA
jgi:hypothetical protein